MKISGSEQVTINASFDVTFVAAESNAIKETTEKLAREGKTVVNIIHGTPWRTPIATMKTLTFLWEGDDQHPLYLAARERERVAAERRRQEEEKKRQEEEKKAAEEWERTRPEREKQQQRQALETSLKATIVRAAELSERIARAENKNTEKKDLREYKTWGIKHIVAAIGILVGGIVLGGITISVTSSLEAPFLGVIFFLVFIGIAGFIAFAVYNDADKVDKHINLEQRNRQLAADRANLKQLKETQEDVSKQIVELRQSLAKLQ